jgi:hypothetical protein
MPKASEFERFNELIKKMNQRIDRASQEGDVPRRLRAVEHRTRLERRGPKGAGPAFSKRSHVSAFCDYEFRR